MVRRRRYRGKFDTPKSGKPPTRRLRYQPVHQPESPPHSEGMCTAMGTQLEMTVNGRIEIVALFPAPTRFVYVLVISIV